jgi:hypothetical protein
MASRSFETLVRQESEAHELLGPLSSHTSTGRQRPYSRRLGGAQSTYGTGRSGENIPPYCVASCADSLQIWDLFEGEHLFGDIFDAKGGHEPFKHLALMVALIGPPPSEFAKRSETTEQCFDHGGKPCHRVGRNSRADA